MKRLLALALLALALPLQAAWDVAALMALLADNPGGRARFVETKYLAALDAPIEARGELVYRPPGRLERHTETPTAESMVLDGDTITLTRAGKSWQLRLDQLPEAAALIDSIRGTLAGDRAALSRNYALSLSGSRAAWTLHLLPSDPQLAALLLRITVAGRAGQVDSVEVRLADGDRSVMRIEPIEHFAK